MSVAIPVSDVLAMVRFRLHLPAFGPDEFVTDADALLLVQSAAKRLSARLTRLWGDDYFTTTGTLTTTPGSPVVSLSPLANFATLLSLHWLAGERAYELERAQRADYAPVARAWSMTASQRPTYRLERNQIALLPAPLDAHTLRVKYTTGIFVLSIADDVIDGQIGWDEWLVADICQRIREREQKDATEFLRDKAEADAMLEDQAAGRDRVRPAQVADTRELDQRRLPRDVLPWNRR